MLLHWWESKVNLTCCGLEGGWFSADSAAVALITGVDDRKYRGLTLGFMETDMEIVNKGLHADIHNRLDWDQTGQHGHCFCSGNWSPLGCKAHSSGLCGVFYGPVCWASASQVRWWERDSSVLGYSRGHSREGGTQVLSQLSHLLQDTSSTEQLLQCEGTVPQVFCAPTFLSLLVSASGIISYISGVWVPSGVSERLFKCLTEKVE